jgi:hypothetical protein
MSYNHYENARLLSKEIENYFPSISTDINDALLSGVTSTEILMNLRSIIEKNISEIFRIDKTRKIVTELQKEINKSLSA